MFTTQFIPGANKELADWFNEFQRISSSPADAARNLLANGEADVERVAVAGQGADAGHARPQ